MFPHDLSSTYFESSWKEPYITRIICKWDYLIQDYDRILKGELTPDEAMSKQWNAEFRFKLNLIWTLIALKPTVSNYNRIARVDKVRHGDHRVVPSCELLHRDDPIETRSPIDEMARYNSDKVVQRYEVTQVLVRTSSSY